MEPIRHIVFRFKTLIKCFVLNPYYFATDVDLSRIYLF